MSNKNKSADSKKAASVSGQKIDYAIGRHPIISIIIFVLIIGGSSRIESLTPNIANIIKYGMLGLVIILLLAFLVMHIRWLKEAPRNILTVDGMDRHEFEYFAANLFKKNGYKDVEVTRGSGDHGIDVLAEKDGITYAIQCKCYKDNIGNAAVQQAYTGKDLFKKDIAVVLTNRYFTPQAIEEATNLGVKLWDRKKLIELMNKSEA